MKHPIPAALAHLPDALRDLEKRHLLRSRQEPRPPGSHSFCSNDYLGLAHLAPPPVATGAGSSPLLAGQTPEHAALEAALAAWLRVECALAFSTGFAANVGLLPALAQAGDHIFSDTLNHASIIDGARLSRAETHVYAHCDIDALDALLRGHPHGRHWVVTESYFSMDADAPDLPRLRAVCDRHCAALVLDEAHALGVLGPDGRGLAAAAGVLPDVLVGTLGKALGAGGAFVAGCRPLVDWLWNRCRSFVFSTGLSPALAAASRRSVDHLLANPALRSRVLGLADRFRAGLTGLGLAPLGFGHVVPVVVGAAPAALRAAADLRALGVHVLAVRPPTVPHGTARLRFTLSAAHSDDDVDRALAAIRSTLPW